MKTMKRMLAGCIALMVAISMIASAYAAYPKRMEVTVEMWNDVQKDLRMTYASWLPAGTDLGNYVMPGDYENGSFKITLNNPRNDAAVFRFRSDNKHCEFRLAHQSSFSWFGVSPAPSKSANGKSIGSEAAQCNASVTKGTNSLGSYTVRFSMK